MANSKREKVQKTFDSINTALALLEKLPYFSDVSIDISNGGGYYGFYTDGKNFNASISPLGLLFSIIKAIGVDEGTLKGWIIDMLVNVLPFVETGIKATILSNIKSIVSCSSDPRIPIWLRKHVKSNNIFGNSLYTDEDRGINIGVDAIDPDGILNLSPFTEPGMLKYFGCVSDTMYDNAIRKKTEVPYEGNVLPSVEVNGDGLIRKAKLARADDFNAFLWYAMHGGNGKMPTKLNLSDAQTKCGFKYFEFQGVEHYITKGQTLLGEIKTSIPRGDCENKYFEKTNILPGDTFYDPDNMDLISMSIKNIYASDKETPIGNVIVPVSSNWFSLNWYVDKNNYYSSNLGFKRKSERNYSNEKAICNIRYFKRSEVVGSTLDTGNAHDYFKFTILPKPYVMLPDIKKIEGGETVEHQLKWRPIRLLFNANGDADQKGKYSLDSESANVLTKVNEEHNISYYNIKDSEGTQLLVSNETGEYSLSTKDHIEKFLVECYPGLTVYEFNYDFLMGMKLFDAKVICQRLFENTLNPAYNANFSLSFNKLKDLNNYPYFSDKQRLLGIITNVLYEDEDEEINDCFFSFSNEQYDEMLRKTEEIKLKNQPFNQGYADGETFNLSNVFKTLSEYPETGTLNDQISVIDKSIEQVFGIFDEQKKVLALEDSSTLKVDFMNDMLSKLTMIVVDSILSPKLLMLLIVNNTLMGDEGEYLSTEALMKAMKGLIKGIVREVRDLIMKKILDYIISYLTPIALQMKYETAKEQDDNYMSQIEVYLKMFRLGKLSFGVAKGIINGLLKKFKKHKGNNIDSEIDLPSVLDEITYADIYETETKNDSPIINDC